MVCPRSIGAISFDPEGMGEVAGMKKVMAFFRVRLHISGWVRLEENRISTCFVGPTVRAAWAAEAADRELKTSAVSVRRHSSQFFLGSPTVTGPRRRTPITTRSPSTLATALRTTIIRTTPIGFVVRGDEASPCFRL